MGTIEEPGGRSHVDRGAIEGTPNPTRPGLTSGSVKTVKKLHLEAGVLVGDGADAEPSFTLVAADVVPCNQALGSTDFVDGTLEESAV